MKEKKYTLAELKTMHLVEIIEMDRFSGPSVDEEKLFTTKEEALEFCKTYNSKNTESSAPEWYMVANYRGKAI